MRHLKKFNEAIGIDDDGVVDHTSKHADVYYKRKEEESKRPKPESLPRAKTFKNGDGLKFGKIIKDGSVEDITTFLKENDYDINVDMGFILRHAIASKRYDLVDYFVKNGGNLSVRRYIAVKWYAERGDVKGLEVLFKHGLRLDARAYADIVMWTQTSDEIPDDEKGEVLAFLPKLKQ